MEVIGKGKRAYYSARAELARKLGDIAGEHYYRYLSEELELESGNDETQQ